MIQITRRPAHHDFFFPNKPHSPLSERAGDAAKSSSYSEMRVAEFSNVRCKKAKSPLPGATAPSGPGSPHYGGFTITFRPLPDHTHTHTQHLQEVDIHATRRNSNPHPSKRAATDPRLRRRAPWDRLLNHISVCISIYASKQESESAKDSVISSILNFFVHECLIY